MPKPPDALNLEDVPGAPSRGSVLCRISDLEPQESRTFTFTEGTLRFQMFVQRWGDEIYAYKNSCPHVRLPLDYRPGRFLDIDNNYLHCANHGALFRVEDGKCIKGPCKGKYLTPIHVVRDGDAVRVG